MYYGMQKYVLTWWRLSQMNDKFKKLTKNIGIFALSSFGSRILTLLLVPLYTGILTTSEYGQYELLITTVYLLIPIFTLDINSAVMRFLINKESKEKEYVGIIGFRWTLLSCMLFSILLLINYHFELFVFLIGYELIALTFFSSNVILSYLSMVAKGLQKVTIIAIAGIINTISVVIFNLLFLLVLRWGLIGFFLANILGNTIPVFFYFSIKDIRQTIGISLIFKRNKSLSKKMLLYSMPLVLTTISWTINNSLDKFMVNYIIGISASGLISVAYKIPNILAVLQNIFNSAWQISAIEEYDNNGSFDFYGIGFDKYLSFSAISCSGTIILAEFTGKILFSGEFVEAWRYVPFLLLSAFFNSAAGFMGPILAAKMNSRRMATSGIVGIAVNFILNYLFILVIGLQGAAIATALSSFSIFFVRYQGVNVHFNRNVRLRLVILTIILTVQSSIMVFKNNYIFQAVLFIAILFICRHLIISLLKYVFMFMKQNKQNK